MTITKLIKKTLIASFALFALSTPALNANASENLQANGGISGLVWIDNNGNSKFDIDELPLQNVTVRLYNNNGVETDKTSTDVAGIYNFNNVPVGTYTVSIVLPTGYSFSPLSSLSDVDMNGKSAVDIATIHFKTVNAGLIPSGNVPAPIPAPDQNNNTDILK